MGDINAKQPAVPGDRDPQSDANVCVQGDFVDEATARSCSVEKSCEADREGARAPAPLLYFGSGVPQVPAKPLDVQASVV
jgi:hypothetical protein